jgi:hypothetical protein
MLAAVVGLFAIPACGTGIGQTSEPGVEHIPGPGFFVIRVVPGDAIDARRIEFPAYGDRTVKFPGRNGADRYLTGISLPATLTAVVDGQQCVGSIAILSDVEYDGTLTIDGPGCELRLDLAHRAGTIDHHLEDDGPIRS